MKLFNDFYLIENRDDDIEFGVRHGESVRRVSGIGIWRVVFLKDGRFSGNIKCSLAVVSKPFLLGRRSSDVIVGSNRGAPVAGLAKFSGSPPFTRRRSGFIAGVKLDLLFIRLCFAGVLSSNFDKWGHCQIG